MPACPRCAELEERIRWLEGELTGDWHPPIEWDLSRSERTVLSALLHREMMTLQGLRLLTRSEDENSVRVAIWRLRRWAQSRGIKVRNRYGVGWYLTKADKDKLKAMAA